MTAEEIKHLINAGLDCQQVDVDGDGHHWFAVIVSQAFAGHHLVARHKMVYATLQSEMESNALHALSMKTLTPDEWAAQQA